jgi:ribulose-phosphate 3-epimerase
MDAPRRDVSGMKPLHGISILPSILSADFGRLAEEVRAVEAAGADLLHVDVMDGRFVPNITMGPLVVKAIRKVTKLPLDLHLMIVEPEKYLEAFADAGADTINIHFEATVHSHRALQHIRSFKKRAGLALNPQTSEEALRYLLGSVDQVLVMSVNPGFGGQAFLPEVLPKVRAIRKMIEEGKHPVEIEIDGGIALDTIGLAVSAGACALVAGNAIFTQKDYGAAITGLRAAAEAALAPRTAP